MGNGVTENRSKPGQKAVVSAEESAKKRTTNTILSSSSSHFEGGSRTDLFIYKPRLPFDDKGRKMIEELDRVFKNYEIDFGGTIMFPGECNFDNGIKITVSIQPASGRAPKNAMVRHVTVIFPEAIVIDMAVKAGRRIKTKLRPEAHDAHDAAFAAVAKASEGRK